MYKIATLVTLLLLIISCKKEEVVHKDYAQFSGKITNPKDSIISINSQKLNRTIKVNDDGTFSDTLKVNEDFFLLIHGDTRTVISLKNGYNLNFDFNSEDLLNSAEFSGLGADINKYMVAKMKLENEYNLNTPTSFFELDKSEFESTTSKLASKMEDLLNNAQGLDSTFTAQEAEGNDRFINYLTSNYDTQHEIYAPIAKGKPSPVFNYPDTDGKLVALEDFKGKYVYIDVWATWCGPCIQEIPSLKQLHSDFENKNLAIISLSIDKMSDKEKWKNMVADKNLTGTQIMVDNEYESDFIKGYSITSIPRFILLDPDGNIVDNNAPRPSDPALRTLFSELEI